MKELFKECWKQNMALHILTYAAIILIAAGFIVPPLGIIDNSVIIAVGEITGLGALWELNKSIDKGIDAKVKIKEIELSTKQPGNSEEDIKPDED